jgi:hypothetical protein
MNDQDFDHLARFVALYEDAKAAHWRDPAFESRPAALKRVLAIAREYNAGANWSDQIDNYLEAFRLALPTARLLTELNSRTTIWSVSGPAFVRRMSGNYRLDLRGASDGDWRQVVWVKIEDQELAIDLWIAAKRRNTTVSRILAAALPAALQLIEGED